MIPGIGKFFEERWAGVRRWKVRKQVCLALGLGLTAFLLAWGFNQFILKTPVLTPFGEKPALTPLYAFWIPRIAWTAWVFPLFCIFFVVFAARFADPKRKGRGEIPAVSRRLLPGPAPWTFPDPQAGFPTRVSIQHLSRRGIHFRRDPDPEPGRFPPRIRGTHAPPEPAWEAFSTRACHIPVYRSAIFREFPPGGGNGSPGRFLQRNPDVLWRFQNPSERICRSLGSPPAARLPPLSSISLALQWMPSSSPSRPWISG